MSRSLSDERQLVVVIDGLDEASDFDVNVGFFPEAPPGVRYLASARQTLEIPNHEAWLARLGWDRPGAARVLHLPPLREGSVSAALASVGGVLEGLSRRSDIVRELHRLTGGDPLRLGDYIDRLMKDAAEEPRRVERLTAEELAELEPDLARYFKHRALASEQDTLTGTLLAVLACAYGPITADDIRELIPESSPRRSDIQRALGPLSRFVMAGGTPSGYVLGHPSYRDDLRTELGNTELVKARERFLDWGRTVLRRLHDGTLLPTEAPPYLVRHLGAHFEQVRTPLADRMGLFSRVWRRACEESGAGQAAFVADVERLWSEAMRLDRIAMTHARPLEFLGIEIACARVLAHLRTREEVPAKVVGRFVRSKKWSTPRALGYAREVGDPEERAVLLATIAQELGPRQRADVEREAWSALQSRPPRRGFDFDSGFFEFFHRASLTLKEEVMQSLPAESAQRLLMMHVSSAVKAGALLDAERTLAQLDPEFREASAQALVLALLSADDIVGARRCLPLVRARAHLVAATARRLAQQGMEEAAVSLLEQEEENATDLQLANFECAFVAEARGRKQILSYLTERTPQRETVFPNFQSMNSRPGAIVSALRAFGRAQPWLAFEVASSLRAACSDELVRELQAAIEAEERQGRDRSTAFCAMAALLLPRPGNLRMLEIALNPNGYFDHGLTNLPIVLPLFEELSPEELSPFLRITALQSRAPGFNLDGLVRIGLARIGAGHWQDVCRMLEWRRDIDLSATNKLLRAWLPQVTEANHKAILSAAFGEEDWNDIRSLEALPWVSETVRRRVENEIVDSVLSGVRTRALDALSRVADTLPEHYLDRILLALDRPSAARSTEAALCIEIWKQYGEHPERASAANIDRVSIDAPQEHRAHTRLELARHSVPLARGGLLETAAAAIAQSDHLDFCVQVVEHELQLLDDAEAAPIRAALCQRIVERTDIVAAGRALYLFGESCPAQFRATVMEWDPKWSEAWNVAWPDHAELALRLSLMAPDERAARTDELLERLCFAQRNPEEQEGLRTAVRLSPPQYLWALLDRHDEPIETSSVDLNEARAIILATLVSIAAQRSRAQLDMPWDGRRFDETFEQLAALARQDKIDGDRLVDVIAEIFLSSTDQAAREMVHVEDVALGRLVAALGRVQGSLARVASRLDVLFPEQRLAMLRATAATSTSVRKLLFPRVSREARDEDLYELCSQVLRNENIASFTICLNELGPALARLIGRDGVDACVARLEESAAIAFD